jgi:hypothetical protein
MIVKFEFLPEFLPVATMPAVLAKGADGGKDWQKAKTL